MRHKKVMALFVSVVLAVMVCADLQAGENFRVYVGVAGVEDAAKQAKSYVERELRLLGDVTVVDDVSSSGRDYDILISCVADEKDSRRVYLAVVFTKNLKAVYDEISAEIEDPASREFIDDFLAMASVVPVSFPQPIAGAERDLEAISRTIVTTFNDMVLGANRRILERYGENLDPRNLLAALWAEWTE